MTILAQKIEELTKDLVADGLLTADQLAVAQESQKNMGGNVGEILIQRGFVTENDLLKKLGKKFGLTVMSLASYQPDSKILKLIPSDQARRWKVIPLFEVEEKVTIATADPFNLTVLDEVRTDLGRDIDCVLSSASEIEEAIGRYYGKDLKVTEDKVEVVRYEMEESVETDSPLAQLEKEAQGAKVVSTVNQLLSRAHKERASDIHLEPARDVLKVRLRVDGVLEELQNLPKTMHQPTISRVKILGGIDVAERRVPQDGRVRIKIGNKEIDLRIATYPTMFGEAAAIRILAKEQLITLEGLGFLESERARFEEIITKPHGIFLVTGPTGSGKTTTLYAALQRIDRRDKHVLSVEDPVEHEIEGVDQTQINPKAGITFASAIRAMLRQDPDVIMVGEIRDQETADITLRAAMTGHLVFSTLHTNSAIGAVARLKDLGVEPYLISSTLLGVMAQRLARKICSHCREEVEVSPKEMETLKASDVADFKAFHGKGCRICRMTGYQGRVGLFELIQVTDEIRHLLDKMDEQRLREKMTTIKGYRSIMEDGIEKIRKGITTVGEVLRVSAEA